MYYNILKPFLEKMILLKLYIENCYNRAMSDIRSLFNAGTGDAELVIRSHVTPEITIKLADLLIPGQPSEQAIASDHPMIMRAIKPELIIQTLGIERPYSPYGRPRAGMASIILAGVACSGLVGALISWAICKNYV